MGRSFSIQIQRAQKRIARNRTEIADFEREKIELDLKIEILKRQIEADVGFCQECEARILRREQEGLLRSTTAPGELSNFRPTRVKQVLVQICLEHGLDVPSWIAALKEPDIMGTKTIDLMDKFFMHDDFVGALVPAEKRAQLRDQALALMSDRAKAGESDDEQSEKPKLADDLFVVAPGWQAEAAHQMVARFRSEFGVIPERAVQISKRAMVASTAWSLTKPSGDWLNDSALQLMERVRPIGEERVDVNAPHAKAAGTIEIAIRRALKTASPPIDNLRLLEEAVSVFATPGAMARAYASALTDDDRKFARDWFDSNRHFASQIGHRVGSPAAFEQIVADPAAFSAKHSGPAPLLAPFSQNWAEEERKIVFRKEAPIDLINEARHALVDTTLNASLVSLPKIRDRFLNLGSWEGREAIHAATIDVSRLTTRSFLSEARDAAEVEAMQGTNPLAMTVGLVTWVSADGKTREAPLFLAFISFDEETATVTRTGSFLLNRALFRRIEVDYPSVVRDSSIFDALQDVIFAPDLQNVFARVIAAVGARASGKCPILKIEDLCLVGSFDSARAVLERRLDLKVFPSLVDKPVIRLLAEGSTEKLVLADYEAQEGVLPPDEKQHLAVRAALGGTSFVLEGPPGTGKTATIVSMLEALNKAGKRVLVSASMPGAIEVIGRRSRGRFGFFLSTLRDGEIDLGVKLQKTDLKNSKSSIFLGTPMALIREMPSDFTFDVLIVDEASQLRLSHALALAGHVRQIIIAGDSRQLQPQLGKDGTTSEMSLLKRARDAGFPVVMLENHYRSRHPSLIAWSNTFSYGSKLKPKRGPWLLGDAGFDVNYIDTGRRISQGDEKVNVEEAEAIAAEVVRWAKDGTRSVGVVALTQAQRNLIRKVVDDRLSEAGISLRDRHAEERALETSEGVNRPIGFFSSKEPFFVRTAGAIQGEERDVMLISLGVGPDENGNINQSAGLLSRPDALAMVNVMLSRARIRTAVYASIMPWQISMTTMTPGMFLVASILRTATVVAIPDSSLTPAVSPKEPWSALRETTLVSDLWTVDKLTMGDEDFYALRLPQITDRYALAVTFKNRKGQDSPVINELYRSGWNVTSEDRPSSDISYELLVMYVRNRLVAQGLLQKPVS